MCKRIITNCARNVFALWNNTKKFMAIEEEVLAKLSDIDNISMINGGGCAIVAYELVWYLKCRGISADVVYIHDCTSYDKRQIASLNNRQPASCAHAVVKIGKYYYDSSGKRSHDEIKSWYSYDYEHVVPFDVVQTSIMHGGWNSAFDRSNASKIHKILEG